jgi:4-amino-4-deoxy-L-arabinose transferase-like glycosyltransferase
VSAPARWVAGSLASGAPVGTASHCEDDRPGRERGPGAPAPRGARDWLGLLGLWVLATAANLLKPYHVDDTAYLAVARWIEGHPWHPMRGLLNWGGTLEPISQINQPHLYFYLMALWGRLFGFGEPAMHALQAVPAALCVLFCYRLCVACRVVAPFWATALLTLGPAFIVEQNLMVDVPLLACWLGFFLALIGGIGSERQTRRYLIAGAACAVALLIKYSSLVLLPILCLSLVIERQRSRAWVVLLPLGALAAWSVFNYIDYGGVHMLTRTHGVRTLKLLITWPVGIGALTPLGWVVAGQARSRERLMLYVAAPLALATLAAGVALGWVPERVSNVLLWLAFAINAVLICRALAPALARAWRLRRAWQSLPRERIVELYLVLWVVGTTLFYVLFAPFMAARHALLVLPPVTLLLMARWGAALTRDSRIFALLVGVCVSTSLALADWRFADFYRAEADSLASSLPAVHAWASGHWGWQWYTERHGIVQVDVRSSPLAVGDLVLVAREANPQPLTQPLALEHLRTDTERPAWQPFCTSRNGGFYGYRALMQTPWSLTRACVHHIDILRMRTE